MNGTTPTPGAGHLPSNYRPAMGDVLRIESKGQEHDAEVFEIAHGSGFGVKWESGRHPKAPHLPGLWRTYFNADGSPKYGWKIVGIVKLARADSPTCEACGGYGHITINAGGDEGSCGVCYKSRCVDVVKQRAIDALAANGKVLSEPAREAGYVIGVRPDKPTIDTVSGPVETEEFWTGCYVNGKRIPICLTPSLESAEKMVKSAVPFDDDDFGDVELGPACKLGDTECESCQ
jgi:hypothetical protein